MKAIVCTKYGSPDVLQLQEVAKPAPLDDEVLIQNPCGLRQCPRLALHESKTLLYPSDTGRLSATKKQDTRS